MNTVVTTSALLFFVMFSRDGVGSVNRELHRSSTRGAEEKRRLLIGMAESTPRIYPVSHNNSVEKRKNIK
jgi:hypothetical protein